MEEEDKVNWRKTAGVFAILFLGVMAYTIIDKVWDSNSEPEMEINTSALSLCSRITGTPSWANGYGEILTEVKGYQEQMNETYVDWLISDKVYFLYNPSCGWCQKQIDLFGSEWDKYKNSGFAVDCSIKQRG
jgi:hypothetical protein